MTTIIEDQERPLIWFGKENNMTEPRTEAGRALTRGYPDDLTAPDPASVVEVERQSATLALLAIEAEVPEAPPLKCWCGSAEAQTVHHEAWGHPFSVTLPVPTL